jgi:predicted metal-dependent hydrolase
MNPQSQQIQAFIDDALARLPYPEQPTAKLQLDDIHRLITDWQKTLGITVMRVQIRTMRNKWGSISTAGTLTLAEDLLALPHDLVEYVIVHELLHLKFPDHRKGWQVSMGMYLPNWRAREYRLQQYVLNR